MACISGTSFILDGGLRTDICRCLVVSVVRSKDTDLSTRIQQILKTESEISAWWQRVPRHFKLDTSTVLATNHNTVPKMLLTNLVYHQSLCALHSSIVPLFCWSKGDRSYSTARQLSAQIAYEHACTISSLIRSVSNNVFPFSSMPIFVAYAAYSSCAVQIPFLWCSQPEVKAQAQLNVETNVKMIQDMSSYWKLASLLVRVPPPGPVLKLIRHSMFMRDAFTTFINVTHRRSPMNLNTRTHLHVRTLELMQTLRKRLFLSSLEF